MSTFFNQNEHPYTFSWQNVSLWVMALVHCGICATRSIQTNMCIVFICMLSLNIKTCVVLLFRITKKFVRYTNFCNRLNQCNNICVSMCSDRKLYSALLYIILVYKLRMLQFAQNVSQPNPQRASNAELKTFLRFGINKLLNGQSSYQWFHFSDTVSYNCNISAWSCFSTINI